MKFLLPFILSTENQTNASGLGLLTKKQVNRSLLNNNELIYLIVSGIDARQLKDLCAMICAQDLKLLVKETTENSSKMIFLFLDGSPEFYAYRFCLMFMESIETK